MVIVNELWIPESLSVHFPYEYNTNFKAGTLADITKERFRVSGVQSQTTNESSGSPDAFMEKSNSLQVKPVIEKRIQDTQYFPTLS